MHLFLIIVSLTEFLTFKFNENILPVGFCRLIDGHGLNTAVRANMLMTKHQQHPNTTNSIPKLQILQNSVPFQTLAILSMSFSCGKPDTLQEQSKPKTTCCILELSIH